jgi:hypothetical protein
MDHVLTHVVWPLWLHMLVRTAYAAAAVVACRALAGYFFRVPKELSLRHQRRPWSTYALALWHNVRRDGACLLLAWTLLGVGAALLIVASNQFADDGRLAWPGGRHYLRAALAPYFALEDLARGTVPGIESTRGFVRPEYH